MLDYIIFSVLGFISGSILYSYLIARIFTGVDIREMSDDGNPGASNVFKSADMKYGIAALVLDILKGFLPVYLAVKALDYKNMLFILILIAPVLGHALAPFFKWHGGKAIAVTFGCLLGLIPVSNIVLALAAALVFFTFIIVVSPNSLRCIIAFSLFASYSFKFVDIRSLKYGCLIICAIVIFKHLKSFEHEKVKLHVTLLNLLKHRG